MISQSGIPVLSTWGSFPAMDLESQMRLSESDAVPVKYRRNIRYAGSYL
jgi:hypothetical protein